MNPVPRQSMQQWTMVVNSRLGGLNVYGAGPMYLASTFSQPRSWAITGIRFTLAAQNQGLTYPVMASLIKNRTDQYFGLVSGQTQENVLCTQVLPKRIPGSDVTVVNQSWRDGYRISAGMPVSLYLSSEYVAGGENQRFALWCTMEGFYVR